MTKENILVACVVIATLLLAYVVAMEVSHIGGFAVGIGTCSPIGFSTQSRS